MLHWTPIQNTNSFDKTIEMYYAQRPESHLGLPKNFRLKVSKLRWKLVLRAATKQTLLKIGANVKFGIFPKICLRSKYYHERF